MLPKSTKTSKNTKTLWSNILGWFFPKPLTIAQKAEVYWCLCQVEGNVIRDEEDVKTKWLSLVVDRCILHGYLHPGSFWVTQYKVTPKGQAFIKDYEKEVVT